MYRRIIMSTYRFQNMCLSMLVDTAVDSLCPVYECHSINWQKSKSTPHGYVTLGKGCAVEDNNMTVTMFDHVKIICSIKYNIL